MAELTNVESKLAEVLGLAQAAQGATDKVSGPVEDDSLKETLQQMNDEAAETERRATEFAECIEGKKTAILDAAGETKTEATEMMKTWRIQPVVATPACLSEPRCSSRASAGRGAPELAADRSDRRRVRNCVSTAGASAAPSLSISV